MCLISCDGQYIHYAAVVERRNKITSTQWRLTFSRFVSLSQWGPNIRDLVPFLDSAALRRITSDWSTGHSFAVPPATWRNLLRAIQDLHPDCASSLQEVEAAVAARRRRQPTNPGFEVMAQELDAISTALWIAGLDKRKELYHRGTPWPQSPTPGIVLTGGVPIPEDKMIVFDNRVITSTWQEILRNQVDCVLFENNEGKRLTVLNANRTAMEKVLGVDLIYVNHAYRSFVMVQYKRMTRKKGQDWEFRPDGQFDEELMRMQSLVGVWPEGATINQPFEYRLHTGPFYFKFVPATVQDAFSTKPLSGMYLPLDYWQILENSPDLTGPRGGKRVTFNNVGRHMTTTDFVRLMQRGWIGSHIALFDDLAELVLSNLYGTQLGGNSIILAVDETPAA